MRVDGALQDGGRTTAGGKFPPLSQKTSDLHALISGCYFKLSPLGDGALHNLYIIRKILKNSQGAENPHSLSIGFHILHIDYFLHIMLNMYIILNSFVHIVSHIFVHILHIAQLISEPGCSKFV